MKRKIAITLLISTIVMLMSLSVLATNAISSNEYDTMLISLEPDLDYVTATDDYAVIPITDNIIKVQLDGEYLDFTDENGNVVNPEIINDRTMVPMRKIFETFDAEIKWDGTTRTVVATTTEREITLTIDNNVAKLKDLETNEEKEITLDTAPLILNDRTMVPVRFIAESLEKEVGWDAEERTVIIIDYAKIEKELEERVPALKELFEIEIEALESFKSTSKITGELVYKDGENKSNNETVKIKGNLDLNVNKAKDMEMYLDIEFEGNGTIYDSLKESGQETIKAGIIVVDGKTYMMMEQAGEEIVADIGENAEMREALSGMQTTSVSSYAEFVEVLKTSLGELDVDSYAATKLLVEVFAELYSEENLVISGSSSKKTVKLAIDLKELLGAIVPDVSELLAGIDFKMAVIEKIANKKVESAKVEMEMKMEEPTTKESMELELKLDMDFLNINKDFEIEVPEVTAA